MHSATRPLIVLLISTLCLSLHSQSWTYKSGGNEFDGKYKTSGIYGSGGEYPYNKARLVVNFFLENQNLNIYITGAGYSGCGGKDIYLKFEGDNTKYRMRGSSDSEKESWFISEGYQKPTLTKAELLSKLKKHSVMHVRLKSNCGQDDYKFSLSGSTAAINYTVGNYHKTLQAIEEKEKKKALSKAMVDSIFNAGGKISALTKFKSSILIEPSYSGKNVGSIPVGEDIIISRYDDNYVYLHECDSFDFDSTATYYISFFGVKRISMKPIEY